MIDIEGPLSYNSAPPMIGELILAQERCLTVNGYGLAILLVYPSGEDPARTGVLYLFKLFLPAFTALRGRGSGRPLWFTYCMMTNRRQM
jgi:hypothetical protein